MLTIENLQDILKYLTDPSSSDLELRMKSGIITIQNVSTLSFCSLNFKACEGCPGKRVVELNSIKSFQYIFWSYFAVGTETQDSGNVRILLNIFTSSSG